MLYSEMNEKEQKKWRKSFLAFDKEQLPILVKGRSDWKPEYDAITIKALELIGAFSYAQTFVKDSLMYKNFSLRISAMTSYFDKIEKDLSSMFEQDDQEKSSNVFFSDSTNISSTIEDISENLKPFISTCKVVFASVIKWIKKVAIDIYKKIKQICCTQK